jgi:DNA-binding response OmpR family regulator
MHRILIVEDESRITAPLEKGFKTHGFITTIASDGNEALRMARDNDFDLLILDLGLPGKNGWEVLKVLRERGEQLPIIILTAQDSIHDRVSGLTGGANDYVTKPFSFQELLARVRLRLQDAHLSQTKAEQKLQVGKIIIDLYTHQVWVDERTVELSAREFTLLELLLRHPYEVIRRERILHDIWGYTSDPGTNIVDVYIGYLRKKIGNNLIETIRGRGYRFVE